MAARPGRCGRDVLGRSARGAMAGWRPRRQRRPRLGRTTKAATAERSSRFAARRDERSRFESGRRRRDRAASPRRVACRSVACVWSPSGGYLFVGKAHETTVGSIWRVTVDPAALAWTEGPIGSPPARAQDGDTAVSPEGRRLIFRARSVAHPRVRYSIRRAWRARIQGRGGEPVTSGGAGGA